MINCGEIDWTTLSVYTFTGGMLLVRVFATQCGAIIGDDPGNGEGCEVSEQRKDN